jgi:hypothetical protein
MVCPLEDLIFYDHIANQDVKSDDVGRTRSRNQTEMMRNIQSFYSNGQKRSMTRLRGAFRKNRFVTLPFKMQTIYCSGNNR